MAVSVVSDHRDGRRHSVDVDHGLGSQTVSKGPEIACHNWSYHARTFIRINRLIGKMCYPFTELFLIYIGLTDDLQKIDRQRIIMGICTVFCFWGCVQMQRQRNFIKENVIENQDKDPILKQVDVKHIDEKLSSGIIINFILANMMILIQQFALSSSSMIFPLRGKDSYKWDAQEQSIVMIVNGILISFTIGQIPIIEKKMTTMIIFIVLIQVCLLATILLSNFHNSYSFSFWTVTLITTLNQLEVIVKSIGSLLIPEQQSQYTFGVLKTFESIGSGLGSKLSVYMQVQYDQDFLQNVISSLLFLEFLLGLILIQNANLDDKIKENTNKHVKIMIKTSFEDNSSIDHID